MLRIPSSWTCARHPCAFVEVREECYLCRLVPVATAALTYKLEAAVQVSCSEARRLSAQDFAPVERHAVTTEAHSDGIVYRPLSSCPTAAGSSSEAHLAECEMVLRCPLFHYSAKEVTVEGPRRDVRGTAAQLTAALMGCYVVPGAQFRTDEGVYTVRHVTLHKGYRGIALVGSDCRVRVNEAPAHSSVTDAPTPPVGLDEEVNQLEQLIACADKSSGSFVGVILRGPRGCGVSSTVRYVLSASSAALTVLSWSASFSAALALQDNRGGTVVLVIPCAEHCFSEAEPELAKMHLRKLQRDVRVLQECGNGQRTSVVVLYVCHAYDLCATHVLTELFAFHVVFTYPSASQRASLIASVRGGTAADWQNAAQCLIGRTCVETLAAARQLHIAAALPFKAVPWSEIGGLEEVKSRLHRALIWPQQRPELMQRFRITPPRGILLYGPPGCAKTTLIKALCTEGNFSLIYLDSATVVSAYVGESERYLRDVFARARRQSPCIVFFDEVEVLGGRRVAGSHDAAHVRLLSTLLTEMDGFADTHGVCFVGATNVPHLLDPALLRPGRFDYMVHVPLPAVPDRVAILALLLRKTAADPMRIAEHTEGFSGADLKVFCSEALLALLKDCNNDVPAIMHDREGISAYLANKAAAFQRTHYDSAALEQFQRDHTSV